MGESGRLQNTHGAGPAAAATATDTGPLRPAGAPAPLSRRDALAVLLVHIQVQSSQLEKKKTTDSIYVLTRAARRGQLVDQFRERVGSDRCQVLLLLELGIHLANHNLTTPPFHRSAG